MPRKRQRGCTSHESCLTNSFNLPGMTISTRSLSPSQVPLGAYCLCIQHFRRLLHPIPAETLTTKVKDGSHHRLLHGRRQKEWQVSEDPMHPRHDLLLGHGRGYSSTRLHVQQRRKVSALIAVYNDKDSKRSDSVAASYATATKAIARRIGRPAPRHRQQRVPAE